MLKARFRIVLAGASLVLGGSLAAGSASFDPMTDAVIRFQTALARCRTRAVRARAMQFLELYNYGSRGVMRLRADSNRNGTLDAGDAVAEETFLPAGVVFGRSDGEFPGTSYPSWIGATPLGSLRGPSAYVGRRSYLYETH